MAVYSLVTRTDKYFLKKYFAFVHVCTTLIANNYRWGLTMERLDAKARTGIAEIALKAFFNIAAEWKLSREQSMIFLGLTATSTYANWKNGKGRNIPRDTLERISYIVAIDRSIPEERGSTKREWLESTTISNHLKLSLFELMLTGNVADLYLARQKIDRHFSRDSELLIDDAFHAAQGIRPIEQLQNHLHPIHQQNA